MRGCETTRVDYYEGGDPYNHLLEILFSLWAPP
jgi:hypothetical protein